MELSPKPKDYRVIWRLVSFAGAIIGMLSDITYPVTKKLSDYLIYSAIKIEKKSNNLKQKRL